MACYTNVYYAYIKCMKIDSSTYKMLVMASMSKHSALQNKSVSPEEILVEAHENAAFPLPVGCFSQLAH